MLPSNKGRYHLISLCQCLQMLPSNKGRYHLISAKYLCRCYLSFSGGHLSSCKGIFQIEYNPQLFRNKKWKTIHNSLTMCMQMSTRAKVRSAHYEYNYLLILASDSDHCAVVAFLKIQVNTISFNIIHSCSVTRPLHCMLPTVCKLYLRRLWMKNKSRISRKPFPIRYSGNVRQTKRFSRWQEI
jgi:hypothetical protein